MIISSATSKDLFLILSAVMILTLWTRGARLMIVVVCYYLVTLGNIKTEKMMRVAMAKEVYRCKDGSD